MGIQKDWLFYDLENGNFFCATIARFDRRKGKGCRKYNRQWYLIRYVNYFSLSLSQVEKLLNMYYIHILSSSHSSEHSCKILHHNFTSKDMNIKYWQNLLGKKSSHLNSYLETIKLPINKKTFEFEIFKLSSKYRDNVVNFSNITYSNAPRTIRIK